MAKTKHESCNVTAHMYPIMLGHIYELSVAIENYNNKKLVSTAEAFLPLRQRIYGILLYENPDTAHVNELCIQSNECPGEATQIPIKLITHIEKFHPGLCKLWSDECHEDLRWNLFVESLTEKNKLSVDSVKKLGFSYVVPVAVLYYLLQERKNMLKEVEIDVILLQAALVKVYTADDIKAMSNQLHSGNKFVRRVAEIATVFTRGVTMVLFLLSACGFPLHEAMPWLYFDGKLLLQKYIEVVKEKKDPIQICEDTKHKDVCPTYRKMRELAMPIKSRRS
ncbi:hypothetical protein L9F63_002871 [Diploptera punctata]|uniref:Uncharacterized protein n=1 Tax=Diploptera punctata TaxID=6984 RepID=A0AAD7ZR48_DIPPU|nr:hypothetical protein L9F63_002871 [Diploptera punctata]